jgi:DNA (cytosine-5)-methyltransferase 1
MASRGWEGAAAWAEQANAIAPTLVGGSKKHGGPDLGPTQAKKRWLELGVNGLGVADEPPSASWNGEPPMLTVRMAALLQGFPNDWPFAGRKTNAYRQVGNAFPPPVAQAVGEQIRMALEAADAGLEPSARKVEGEVGQIFQPASVA